MISESPARRAVAAATVAEAFRVTAADDADRVAVRTIDDAISWTWAELRERVDALAGGLARLGVRRGDTVALMLANRPEFHLADLAAMTLGATPFSIYLTSSPEQVAYIVRDAAPRVAVVEERFRELLAPLVEHVIGVDELEEVSEPGFDSEPHWRAVEPDDVLTLIYTSGTTGPPKGKTVDDEIKAIGDAIAAHHGTPVSLTVRRDGHVETVSAKPFYDPGLKKWRIGFAQGYSKVAVGAGGAARLAADQMWNVTSGTVSRIVQIFKPQDRKQLSGVVGSYEVTRQAFNLSTSVALMLLAIISLSLGIVNLFPFLPLDGGHIFWALAEKVRGRAIPFSVMERAGFVGFALVACLFVIGFTNDIGRLTGPGFGLR